jgi:hypothetical protein
MGERVRPALVAAALAAAALVATDAGAWGRTGHALVQERAVALLPASYFKKFVETNERALLARTRALDCPARGARDEVRHRIDLDAAHARATAQRGVIYLDRFHFGLP